MLIRSTCHKAHTGFTLIEILVTIVIVSIGLLGLAGLQINGLRANISSEARSKATLLADDIAERMRANPLGVTAGAYNNITVDLANCIVPARLCGNTSTNDVVDTCTAVEMATFDIWEWGCGTAAADVKEGGLINHLPGGTATITCAAPCPPGSRHTITVNWTEHSPTDGNEENQHIMLRIIP